MAAVSLLLCGGTSLQAAERWIEVKSPHFTVLSNDDEGATRTVAWQFEQIRSVIEAAYPWARLDLNRPLTVIAVKDENGMRALAPGFWERKGGIRPTSIWVGAPDHFYMAIRSDVRGDEKVLLNPYLTSYFTYVSLILRSSFDRNLPPWFLRGLAAVWSNSIVRRADVVIGAPIPYYLGDVRSGVRLPLAEIVSGSADSRSDGRLQMFDAQAWALVHYLMFDESMGQRGALNQFAKRLAEGADHAQAFTETIGEIGPLDAALHLYVNRPILGMGLLKADARVKREGFAVRTPPVTEQAATRAGFHAAMGRPAEARLALDEARKADPSLPAIDVVEAALLDAEQKQDGARAALARAVERGTTNAFAHYRLASLMWRADADRETLQQIDKTLTRAVALDNRYAAAYAFLAQVRAALHVDPEAALALARRAISLEPAESSHHLAAAQVLWRLQRLDEARKEAQSSLALADSDEERRQAKQLIDSLSRVPPGGCP